ncbi:alpha/beta fold hydrolase [Sphingomonas bacterium]|uniref:alpha/beta fold hydrolase n=1 Tax=Sphingomonas bacterium TaxID=1895847 RepID=UPI0015757FCF|nr:alpha/beta fold hydrolase [Sphingomonas bacterium]
MKARVANLFSVLVALLTPAAAHAQTAPVWATVPDVPPLPPPARSGFVDHDGARIYFAVFNQGGGRPVVLLHGGFASSASWGFEVPRLAPRHEVIVIDSRGHGRSTMPAGPLSYRQMTTDVVAVLDRLRVARASVVGVSDGGIVGLLLAIHHSDRVDRLFAWGATFNTHADSDGPPDPTMSGIGARFMARMEANYRAVSATPDGFPALRTALGRLYAIEPDLTPAELGSIRVPTLVADGAHEQFIARSHTEALACMIPGARLTILPNVSHGGPQQDPAAFHQAVASFLDPPRPR